MNTLEALLQLLALDRLPRTGWLQAGVPLPETVAAHGHGVALVTLALAPRVAPPLDADRAAALAVVHDAPEAWLGDLPRPGSRLLPPGAKREAEGRAAGELLGPLSTLALDRYREFDAGETREARFVRLCDRLQMGVRMLGYARAGFRGLETFRQTVAELDCSEFSPCQELRDAILAALEEPGPPGGE